MALSRCELVGERLHEVGVLFTYYRACIVHSFSCGLVIDGVGFDSIFYWKYESLSHFSILGNKSKKV